METRAFILCFLLITSLYCLVVNCRKTKCHTTCYGDVEGGYACVGELFIVFQECAVLIGPRPVYVVTPNCGTVFFWRGKTNIVPVHKTDGTQCERKQLDIQGTTQDTKDTTSMVTGPATQTSHEDDHQSTTIERKKLDTQGTTQDTTQGTTQDTTQDTTQGTTQDTTQGTTQDTTQGTTQDTTQGTTQDTMDTTGMVTPDPATQTSHEDGKSSILIALIATSTLLLVMCTILAGIGLFYRRHMMQRNAARTWTNSSSYIPMATLSPPELDISISCPELRVPATPPSDDPEPSPPISRRTRSKTRGKLF